MGDNLDEGEDVRVLDEASKMPVIDVGGRGPGGPDVGGLPRPWKAPDRERAGF